MRELVFSARKKYANLLQEKCSDQLLEIYVKNDLSSNLFMNLGRESFSGIALNHYLTTASEESLGILFSEIEIPETIEKFLKKFHSRKSLRTTKVMAITNATPDSFFPGSRIGRNLELLQKIIEASPDIIDVGGESTRPGSEEISISEETERLRPVIGYLEKNSNIPISLDTRHHEVLEEFGTSISYINDITGFVNPEMIKSASNHQLKCITMHMRGEPKNMQTKTDYTDVFPEVLSFLVDSAERLENGGIRPEDIFLDPGVGFSKDLSGNLDLIKDASSFNIGYGTLFGTSRKSFLGKITGNDVGERLSATLATTAYLAMEGTDIIRVHDVKENSDVIKVIKRIMKKET